MLPQSETTNPWKFQAPFNKSLWMYLFPVAGIPLISLKEFIKVATPISETALKGGKYVSCNCLRLISTEL